MPGAKFSIGIDLGTTNCALAFQRLELTASSSELFLLSQWETITRFAEAETLPSFLYLPPERESAQMGTGEAWIPGRLARHKSSEVPGRVVQSAKSWLGHHAVDRNASFLPWRSDELSQQERISPVKASALLLASLRAAWDSKYAGRGADFRFDAQEVTITVPASFDAAAQGLTLEAAKDAGFPAQVRLLEEPQAAFYHWLEQHRNPEHLLSQRDIQHLLVVDIGGGTSDFSFFQINPAPSSALPAIKRVAVSDHLLLGGDNIDLALAHFVESRLTPDPLSQSQWNLLIARCRDLKERCLADPAGNRFSVSIPGGGSSLLKGTLSCQIERDEIEGIVLEGFFPRCERDDQPVQTEAGLREWALPYAKDSAVTRYLADFLYRLPPVNSILFNGGSLHPETLRLRLRDQISRWQNGLVPHLLENSDPSLAVARGAAHFGAIVQNRSERIEAVAARAIYLEVHRKTSTSTNPLLVCLLPRRARSEEEFRLEDLGIELRVNRLVRFQAFSSTRRGNDVAGEFVEWNDRDFFRLPPLQAIAKLPMEGNSLPIIITAKMNEVGLLQVSCLSNDPQHPGSWPLTFNLRPKEQSPSKDQDQNPSSNDAFPVASLHLKESLARPPGKGEKITAGDLFKKLEKVLGTLRSTWDLTLIRSLWLPLCESASYRRLSADHEETWLIAVGFFLRPGFGAPGDKTRLDQLWQLHLEGLSHPGKRILLQQFIMWRRVAGGLSQERQEAILLPELPKLRVQKNPPAELIRLAGALEKVDGSIKTELIGLFLTKVRELALADQYCAPYLNALGLLLNRAPFDADPEVVVPWLKVEQTFAELSNLDWSKQELSEISTLFLRAARVVDKPNLDLPKSLRERIASKLERSGVSPLRVSRIRKFEPFAGNERASLFGESLPPGLVMER